MPKPTRSSALQIFLTQAHRALGERLSTEPQENAAVLGDASLHAPGQAAAVAKPRTTAEVSLLARLAQELGIPLVPRGGGSGKCGGAVPRHPHAVVVALQGLNRLLALKVDDGYAEVEAGLTPAELDGHSAAQGLLYPPDPGSMASATLGGTIATNAGGPRALKYGSTAAYVLGLEVVLAGGRILNLGRRTLKGTGGLNLTPLWVGSEGTLGIITAARLRLVPRPPCVRTAWLQLRSLSEALAASAAIFSSGCQPALLELLDEAVLTYGDVTAACPFLGEKSGPVALLVQTDGASERAVEGEMQRLLAAASVPYHLACHEAEQEALLAFRRGASLALSGAFPYKLSDDVALPRSAIPAFVAALQPAAAAQGIALAAYGHLGDGNLHVNLLCKTPQERAQAQAFQPLIWESVARLGGELSGEHGIGILKQRAFCAQRDSEILAIEGNLKQMFDPRDIMNPGKVWPARDPHA